MELQLEEFRRMMEAGRRYLAGQCTIHELNGVAMQCAAAAKVFQAHPAIREITGQWVDMIDRYWNEWGHRSDAIAEEAFRDWLSRQLTPPLALERMGGIPMGAKSERDIEKGYPKEEFVAKLRRLADAIEKGERFEIKVAGERVYVPVRATFTVEHERSEDEEELEFQIKWARKGAPGDE